MFVIVALVLTSIVACNNKKNKADGTEGWVETPVRDTRDSTIYGLCGVATSMNTLQMITDNGDTLMLSTEIAQEDGRVFGGYKVGDRMAVLPGADRTTAEMVVNQAALLGNWVMPNPLDGSDEVGISIKEGGIAESIDQSGVVYKTWRLSRGKLELVMMREGGSEEDETYLYDLVKLGADSLVYKDAEQTFEYSRQKPKEEYGKDVKLEDSEKEFFL